MPHKNSVPLNWRLQKSRYRLVGSRCSCGKTYFPPRRSCSCGGKLKPIALSGRGVIESFTVIHAASDGFESVSPYIIGLMRFPEGPAVTAQIKGPREGIKIGSSVRAVFRRIMASDTEHIIYGTKFVLDERPLVRKRRVS